MNYIKILSDIKKTFENISVKFVINKLLDKSGRSFTTPVDKLSLSRNLSTDLDFLSLSGFLFTMSKEKKNF
jgi:hypothetical protein